MIRSKMRGGFHQVLAQGVAGFRESIDREPGGCLMLANHSCWWDLFLVHLLNETIPVDGYGMMEHFNMVRFGFFRRIGAFSVDRTDPGDRSGPRSTTPPACSRARGRRSGSSPRGRSRGTTPGPWPSRPGIRALVRKAGRVRVVPVAFRYDFWQDERPEALVRFGEPTWVDRGRPARPSSRPSKPA